MSSKGEWLTTWGTSTMEHCSAANKQEQRTPARSHLAASHGNYTEGKSKSQNVIYVVIMATSHSRNGKSIEREHRLVLLGVRDGGRGR